MTADDLPTGETRISDPESFEQLPARPLRVLHVEDDEADFRLLSRNLEQAHLDPAPTLFRAETLAQALEELRSIEEEEKQPYDVILLDLSLPDSMGAETFRRVSERCGDTPVTILSGNHDRDLGIELVKEGAQDFLLKDDMNGDELGRSILYAVERARAFRELTRMNASLKKKSRALKTAQMQLIQAEKLDSLGRIAAGVAHEVKNPLATLQMAVDFFNRKRQKLDEASGMMVDQMEHSIERAEMIIHGMVDLSRNDSMVFEPLNVNAIVAQAIRMVEHEAVSARVRIERDLSAFVPSIRCDEGKIEQVLINFCVNAIQAMASDDRRDKALWVRTYWDQIDEVEKDEGLRDFYHLRSKDHVVVVEIRDEGPGIPEDKLGRVFEPFFTTKSAGKGTGLGLSVSKNIIELHHGHIQLENVENPRGLRVRVYFKACKIPVQHAIGPNELQTQHKG